MKTTSIVTLACALILPAACAKKSADTPPTEPTAAPQPEPAETNDFPDKDENKAGIVIGPKIQELCEIPLAKFDFDSSALSDEAQQSLDALAKCFLDGPATDKGMRLVGHADPRGTEEYNLALGQRRAGSVGGYLGGQGLGNSRLETSSRGELDAAGTDEPTWAQDRRVEIFLAE